MKKISNSTFPVILHLSLCFSMLLYSSFNLYAANDSRFWKRIGPEGGEINHFVTNQNHPEIVYASSNRENFLKSINGGESWVALPYNENLGLLRPFYISIGLAVDSGNPNMLYASTLDGLLKSTDNALHWQPIGSDLNLNVSSFFSLNVPVTQTLRVLSNTNTLSGTGLATSSDGGQHWAITETSINLLHQEKIQNSRIIIKTSDSKNPNILYGVTYDGGGFIPLNPPPYPKFLFKSIDGGSSWVNITATEKKYASGFTIDPNNSEKLYATFADTVFGRNEILMLSDNGGIDWNPLGKISENAVDFYSPQIYIDPMESNIVYANLSISNYQDIDSHKHHFAKSFDSGQTWQIIEIAPYIPGEIAINAQNNQKLLMATRQGILRSDNGGLDWLPSNTGIKSVQGRLTIAESDDSYMYLIDAYDTYYKSTDGGQHWNIFNRKKQLVRDCKSFLVNPAKHQEIICQSPSKLFRSMDAGINWEEFKANNSLKIVYAKDGKTIYSFAGGDISKSSDNGLEWEKLTKFRISPFTQLPIIDPRNPDVIYATVLVDNVTSENKATGLFKSIDGGKSWQFLIENREKPSITRKLIIHPLNSERLIYFTGSKSIFLSEDGGKNWGKTLESLVTDSVTVPEIVFDPNNIDGFYWAKEDENRRSTEGIYHSLDKGISWNLVNEGLEGVRTVKLNSSSRGVFITSQSGNFKLSEKSNFSDTSDCLFHWAETNFPDVFSPASNPSQQWGGYTYRYYNKSNTYLGFFYEQEIHLLQPDLSNKIQAIGLVEYYQNLTSCH